MLAVCLIIFSFSYFLWFRSHIKSKHKKFKIRRSVIDVQFRRYDGNILTRRIKQKSELSTTMNYILFSVYVWSNLVLSTGLRTEISIYIAPRGQICLFFPFFALFEWIGLKWGMKFQARKKTQDRNPRIALRAHKGKLL